MTYFEGEPEDWFRDGKPFAGEADLDHRWASEYRLPLVHTTHPSFKYEVALAVPPGFGYADERWEWPTEDEARVLAWYLDVRMDYYNDRWKSMMRRRPLDVDGSTNTVTFVKIAGAWHYRRMTWIFGSPIYPGLVDPKAGPFVGIEGLVDYLGDTNLRYSKAEHLPNFERRVSFAEGVADMASDIDSTDYEHKMRVTFSNGFRRTGYPAESPRDSFLVLRDEPGSAPVFINLDHVASVEWEES